MSDGIMKVAVENAGVRACSRTTVAEIDIDVVAKHLQ